MEVINHEKYYGYFVYGDKEYVVRFKINGSLEWNQKYRCFEDKHLYVRSADEIICLAALDSHPINNKRYSYGCLLTHDGFVEQRARGVKRWSPWNEVINWD